MIQVKLSEDVKIKEVLDNNRVSFTRNRFELKRKLCIFCYGRLNSPVWRLFIVFTLTQHKTIC